MTEDIQVKVMEDIKEGIVAVCGNNKAQGVKSRMFYRIFQKLKTEKVDRKLYF